MVIGMVITINKFQSIYFNTFICSRIVNFGLLPATKLTAFPKPLRPQSSLWAHISSSSNTFTGRYLPSFGAVTRLSVRSLKSTVRVRHSEFIKLQSSSKTPLRSSPHRSHHLSRNFPKVRTISSSTSFGSLLVDSKRW